MPLASLTIAAMKDRTTPTPALALKMPFDEFAVWSDNLEYVRKSLELPGTVTVVRTSDLATPAAIAELDPTGKAREVVPFQPEVWPFTPAA